MTEPKHHPFMSGCLYFAFRISSQAEESWMLAFTLCEYYRQGGSSGTNRAPSAERKHWEDGSFHLRSVIHRHPRWQQHLRLSCFFFAWGDLACGDSSAGWVPCMPPFAKIKDELADSRRKTGMSWRISLINNLPRPHPASLMIHIWEEHK